MIATETERDVDFDSTDALVGAVAAAADGFFEDLERPVSDPSVSAAAAPSSGLDSTRGARCAQRPPLGATVAAGRLQHQSNGRTLRL